MVLPLQPKPGLSSSPMSLDTTGLEAKLTDITNQLRVLAAATDVASFEGIIADLQSQVEGLTAQLNTTNTKSQNLRALLLQIDDLIDEDTI
jgi:hypothetical protein